MTAQSTEHAVVTGGASGIGAVVVDPLLARGRRVTVFDLAQNARTEVETTAVDLRDEATVEAAWALGPVTGLVACHGIRGTFVSALEMDLDRLRRLYDVHVTGTLAVSRAMVRRPDGAPASNVVVSSTTAYRSWVNQVDYGPGKAAERQLMENLAAEWAPGGVRINAAAPGYTLTPMVQDMIDGGFGLPAIERRTPRGRLGDPAAIAGATVWLLCGATHVIGQCLPVDGGWTVVGR